MDPSSDFNVDVNAPGVDVIDIPELRKLPCPSGQSISLRIYPLEQEKLQATLMDKQQCLAKASLYFSFLAMQHDQMPRHDMPRMMFDKDIMGQQQVSMSL